MPYTMIILVGKIKDVSTGWVYHFYHWIGNVEPTCQVSIPEVKDYIKKHLASFEIKMTDDLYLYYTIPCLNNRGIALKGLEQTPSGNQTLCKINLRLASGVKRSHCATGAWSLIDYDIKISLNDSAILVTQ
nr:MAG: hypothetical protein [Bat faecal associated arli-like virus 1]